MSRRSDYARSALHSSTPDSLNSVMKALHRSPYNSSPEVRIDPRNSEDSSEDEVKVRESAFTFDTSTIKSTFSSMLTAFFTASASSATVLLSQKFAVIITFLLILYSCRSLYIGAEKRRGYGPFMLCLFAFPLAMSQPIMNVLQSLHYYNSYRPLTRFVNFISWIGVIQLMTASLWNSSVDKSILKYLQARKPKALLPELAPIVEDDCTS